MKCLTCERTLTAGGASRPIAASDVELMFAELLGWTERETGWTCAACDCCEDAEPKPFQSVGSIPEPLDESGKSAHTSDTDD